MTSVFCYRPTFASMRLLNTDVVGVESEDKEESLKKSGSLLVKSSSTGTNVIWVQNPLAQLINTDSGKDMPAATIGSSTHPNNEECGIRDVWAHNLEDEFRTIRQVCCFCRCFRTLFKLGLSFRSYKNTNTSRWIQNSRVL